MRYRQAAGEEGVEERQAPEIEHGMTECVREGLKEDEIRELTEDDNGDVD